MARKKTQEFPEVISPTRPTKNEEQKAEELYDAYRREVGGTSIGGAVLLPWADLPERNKKGWRTVVFAAQMMEV